MPSVGERRRCARASAPAAHVRAPSSTRRPAAASAKVEAVATTRRDAESAASSGTTTSQIAANDAIPPVAAASAVTNPVKASEDKHMRALIAAGARQKISGENRRNEPGKDQELDHARRAADEQIDRKRRQRDNAAEQTRRDKGAMARRGQHILLRRRMHQRLDIIAYWREQAHVPSARPALQTRSPFSVAGSCQRPLKRTLRRWRARAAARSAAEASRRRQIPIMVNCPLPRTVAKCLPCMRERARLSRDIAAL